MAPLFETRGAERTDSTSVGLIVPLSTYDIRRLGAWNRVGGRRVTRGSLAIARRRAMRAAVMHVAAVRPPVIAAATELAGSDVAFAATATCMRATRTMSSMDPAWSRILCAAA